MIWLGMGDGFEDTVVERQHVVSTCLVPPPFHHGRHPLRVLGSQVVYLGVIFGHVVELPHVLIEGCVDLEPVVIERSDGVKGDRLPPVVVDGP